MVDRYGRPRRQKITKISDGFSALPAGFGWVLAALAAIFWYIAYSEVISPLPGNQRTNGGFGLWFFVAFTTGSLVWFLIVKIRDRKRDRDHPPPRDFGG